MFKLLSIALLLSLLFFVFRISASELNLKDIKEKIRNTFPEVKTLSVMELQERIERMEREITLIDNRSLEEFSVSHIKDAIHFDPKKDTLESFFGQFNKNEELIIYCSVGYRSAELVQKLYQRGYKNAVSLEGSIFEWANRGNAVYKGVEQTKFVHPFDKTWGRYLKKKYHPTH